MLNSKILVGVSVTPGLGLEVAVTDFVSKTVLKYGFAQLEYDYNRREIADLDYFSEALQDLFVELNIPKGAEICLNIPPAVFKVNDYAAAMNDLQIYGSIEDELFENYLFKDAEPAVSAIPLPSGTTQLVKVGYAAASRMMLIEMAYTIKRLGYKVYSIDTSINSTLNALLYTEKVDVSADSWVLAIVENTLCRVMLMTGNACVDVAEEALSIGEVLDEADNYSTVINALQPILNHVPAKYLYVVSKTDVISAEVLKTKLKYPSPIVSLDVNRYSQEMIVNVSPDIDENIARRISLDVIGASINKPFARYSRMHFNLFNKYLGDVYLSEQPPEISFLGKRFLLSTKNMLTWLIIIAVIVGAALVLGLGYLQNNINTQQAKIDDLEKQIKSIEKFLKENENVSANLFDEGDEIKIGLIHNKKVYSYYSIVGTEIPKKLWLTSLKLGENITIEGQADNLESVYSFFRNVKDYDPSSKVKLQKLALASSSKLKPIEPLDDIEEESIITSMNADYYEFRISDGIEKVVNNSKKKKSKAKK